MRRFSQNFIRQNNDVSKRSMLKSILYGVADKEDIIELHKDEERATHSKILARGKYVHELRMHDVKPGAMSDYLELMAEQFPKIAADPNNRVNLVGSWRTMIGDLDQVLHIWEFHGYPGYQTTMERLYNHPDYKEYLTKLMPLLRKRSNQMCLEFASWPTSSPREEGGVYELRSYTLKPGRLLEWEQQWKHGLACRRKFCQPVGSWFSQLGDLNVVHQMWVYPNLEDRKLSREAAWEVDGWAETVWNTLPLIQSMKSRILVPLSFSPLK